MKKILPFLFCLIFLSCQSDGNLLVDKDRTVFPLMAKVFNGENRSCSGATVSLTDELGSTLSAQTDITGKVLFPKVSVGDYQVTIEKKDYEGASFSFTMIGSDQALYGRLYSYDQLITESRLKMDRGEWREATAFLDRADAIDTNPSLSVFLRSVILWNMGNHKEAALILDKRVMEDDLIPDEALLFLADLYQYDLDDKASAEKILLLLLSRGEKSQLRERLNALIEGDMNE